MNWLDEHGFGDLIQDFSKTGSLLWAIAQGEEETGLDDATKQRLLEALEAIGLTTGEILDSDLASIRGYLGITSFASGGYTGSFGDDGKLAVLHEKELVLNENDTANILKAADIVSGLMLNGLSLGNLSALGIGATAQTLEQQVTIEASFPSVTEHNEIELAL